MCNFMSARKCAFRIIRSVSVFAIVDEIQTVVASPAMDGGGHRERERVGELKTYLHFTWGHTI